jgi:hypothetical protein
VFHFHQKKGPSVRGVGRTITEPVKLPSSGVVIPAGVNIDINFYSFHQNEELWGPNASEWEPDRWLREESLDAPAKMLYAVCAWPEVLFGQISGVTRSKNCDDSSFEAVCAHGGAWGGVEAWIRRLLCFILMEHLFGWKNVSCDDHFYLY